LQKPGIGYFERGISGIRSCLFLFIPLANQFSQSDFSGRADIRFAVLVLPATEPDDVCAENMTEQSAGLFSFFVEV